MRIAPVSASLAVARTLEAVILASGHEISGEAEAELLLIDQLHPAPFTATATPQFLIGRETQGHDVVGCPVRPQQLVRLLLARRGLQHVPLAEGWVMDCLARTVTHPGAEPLSLTEKECALLTALAVAHPNAIPRDALLEKVWGVRAGIDTHTLETHIYRLRHKLAAASPAPGDILTEDGSYRLTGVAPQQL